MIATLATTTAIAVSAFISCTNFNYQHSERCNAAPEPSSFVRHTWGFDGYLETGVYYRQTKVHEDLQFFQMEDVRYFITSRGISYVD